MHNCVSENALKVREDFTNTRHSEGLWVFTLGYFKIEFHSACVVITDSVDQIDKQLSDVLAFKRFN